MNARIPLYLAAHTTETLRMVSNAKITAETEKAIRIHQTTTFIPKTDAAREAIDEALKNMQYEFGGVDLVKQTYEHEDWLPKSQMKYVSKNADKQSVVVAEFLTKEKPFTYFA